jgi:hypothetical protein
MIETIIHLGWILNRHVRHCGKMLFDRLADGREISGLGVLLSELDQCFKSYFTPLHKGK